MRHNHFSMLPERAFQPRPFGGMTKEGAVSAIGDFVGGAVDAVANVVSDAGSWIDNNIIQPALDNPLQTALLVGTGFALGPELLAGDLLAGDVGAATAGDLLAGAGTDAATALGAGAGTDLATALGAGAGTDAATALGSSYVPSAFGSAVDSALTGGSTLGDFGSIGTGGFGTAIPSATDMAAALEQAGFSAGTAANLAGLTAAGIGPTDLLGGATSLADLFSTAGGLSALDSLRAANVLRGLLSQPQTGGRTGGTGTTRTGGLSGPTGAYGSAGQGGLSGVGAQPSSAIDSSFMKPSLLPLAKADPGDISAFNPLSGATWGQPIGVATPDFYSKQAQSSYFDPLSSPAQHFAGGGLVDHNPEFYSEGGISIANRYVKGDGDGTSDSVPAMLASGEFVIPADVVSSLGNGDNDAGAGVLNNFMTAVREHKRSASSDKLPPDSKGPLTYLKEAHKKGKNHGRTK